MTMHRDGFSENIFNGEDVDDREMWSGDCPYVDAIENTK